jgi:drug/metabolite transporter (DMT)-like permease
VPHTGGWQVFSLNAVLLLLGLALTLGSVTYAVQYGIARVPASQSNVIFLFELVVAAIAAYWLTQERMDWNEWVGAIMILASSLLSGQMQATTSLKETSPPSTQSV